MKKSLTAAVAALLLAGSANAAGPVRVAALEAPSLPAGVAVMAWPGGIGIPRVITWASTAGDSGIAWGPTASTAATQAFITYDNTKLQFNVPTGKTFGWSAGAAGAGANYFQLESSGGFALLTATGDLKIVSAGTNFIDSVGNGGSFQFQDSAGNPLADIADNGATGLIRVDLVRPKSSGANFVIQDSGGNVLANIIDNGTTGIVEATGLLRANQWNNLANGASIVITNGGAIAMQAPNTFGYSFQDTGSNVLATIADNGTTGSLSVNSITVGSAPGTTISTGSTDLTFQAATAQQVVVKDTAGVAVIAVGTLSNGFNGVRGSNSQDLRIQAGDTKDLRLNVVTGQTGHLSLNNTDVVAWTANTLTGPSAADLTITSTNGNDLILQGPGAGDAVILKVSGTNVATASVLDFTVGAASTFHSESVRPVTGGGSWIVADSAGNTISTFFDDGTTGSMQLTGTKSRGAITLSGGTGTATVNSGAICVCDERTALNAVRCQVSGTTLTATGTTTDVINYICL